jgi:hypothetical protein
MLVKKWFHWNHFFYAHGLVDSNGLISANIPIKESLHI